MTRYLRLRAKFIRWQTLLDFLLAGLLTGWSIKNLKLQAWECHQDDFLYTDGWMFKTWCFWQLQPVRHSIWLTCHWFSVPFGSFLNIKGWNLLLRWSVRRFWNVLDVLRGGSMGYPSFKLHQPLFLSGCDNHTVRSQGDCRLPRRDRTSVSLAAQSSHTIVNCKESRSV